jgi:hypothetical protein
LLPDCRVFALTGDGLEGGLYITERVGGGGVCLRGVRALSGSLLRLLLPGEDAAIQRGDSSLSQHRVQLFREANQKHEQNHEKHISQDGKQTLGCGKNRIDTAFIDGHGKPPRLESWGADGVNIQKKKRSVIAE